jgi:hypothetical protein
MRALFETTTDDIEEDAYHDSSSSFSSFLSSSFREDDAMDYPISENDSINFRRATSAARKTLATILPKAARLPALGSLLQHNMFVVQQQDVAIASLKYLQVKLFT